MTEKLSGSDPTKPWLGVGAPEPGSGAPPTLPPGAIIADRYRIAAKLGTGGMGTVYRAEDLRLGEDVAIKFLSERWALDQGVVDALNREVRMGRRVTHPNVCRVHDVGEVESGPFLTMEFVDGEDLGSLLRRIGHLPQDKAMQVAVQTGAGLQAAHDQNVIHRDLKPQNVMLDADGNIRITDFGIAATLDEVEQDHDFAGTPIYMAPELFSGTSPTVVSDVYSFGCLIYEVLTGRPPFRGESVKDLLTAHRAQSVPRLAEARPGVDPTIDQVVHRCLSPNPESRPRSVYEVLAALPGWDPLAEALARGETPSPRAVAASPGSGRILPGRASWMVAASAVLVLLGVAMMTSSGLAPTTQLPHPGAVLAEDARRHLAALGYPLTREADAEPAYETWAFDFYQELIAEIAGWEDPDRWQLLQQRRPTAIDFYYRRSPQPIVPEPSALHRAWNDPPIRVPGMVQVRLDLSGGLRELLSVPVDVGTVGPPGLASPPEPDWRVALARADLDEAQLESVPPARVPQVFADRRAAWVGTYPESDLRIRVEAASLRGRIVAFRIIERDLVAIAVPPTQERNENPYWAGRLSPLDLFDGVVYFGAVLLAWHAVIRRRADFRGANRVAVLVFVMVAVSVFAMADHGMNLKVELALLGSALSHGLIRAALFWLLFVAFEPHVRRVWPEVLVSWTRLLSGQARDPLVWSNIVAGIGAGALILLLHLVYGIGCAWLGQPYQEPAHEDFVTTMALAGPIHGIGAMLQVTLRYVGFGMTALMAMVLLKLVLRWRRLAVGGFVVLISLLFAADFPGQHWLAVPIGTAQALLTAWAMIQYGLLGLAAGATTFGLLHGMPLTLDLNAWYAGAGVIAVLAIVGALFYGLLILRGPQRSARSLGVAS